MIQFQLGGPLRRCWVLTAFGTRQAYSNPCTMHFLRILTRLFFLKMSTSFTLTISFTIRRPCAPRNKGHETGQFILF